MDKRITSEITNAKLEQSVGERDKSSLEFSFQGIGGSIGIVDVRDSSADIYVNNLRQREGHDYTRLDETRIEFTRPIAMGSKLKVANVSPATFDKLIEEHNEGRRFVTPMDHPPPPPFLKELGKIK